MYILLATGKSTKTPMSKSEVGAMDFVLWKKLGQEFMYESNMNNQFWCSPDGGSLVDYRKGTITCHMIKPIVPGSCDQVVPVELAKSSCGFSLISDVSAGGKSMLHMEADGNCRPVVDRCGRGSGYPNVTGVVTPRGWIYIR